MNREQITRELGKIADQTFFLCGRAGFMASMQEILTSMGVRSGQLRQERFTAGSAVSTGAAATMYAVEFAKSGGRFVGSSAEPLLMIAERHGIDIPHSCRVGQCGTCATRVLEGEVEMDTEEGLEPKRRAAGYRLMCVGRALGNVKLDA